MKPLDIKNSDLTVLMLIGGQTVLLAEDVLHVNREIDIALNGNGWFQVRIADSEESDPPGAFRAFAVAGFYKAEARST